MRQGNFGSEKIIRTEYVRTYVHPSNVSQGEILHFKYPCISAANSIAARTFRGRKQQQRSRFFLST